MKKKYIIASVALIAVGALALFFLMPRSAATGDAKSESSPAKQAASSSAAQNPGELWSVRCVEGTDAAKPEKGKCEIFQRLSVKESGQRLIEFAIGFPEDKDNARGIIILPLGMLLEPGAQMAIDGGQPLTFRPRYCDPAGCVAYLDLNAETLTKLGNGQQLMITVTNPQQKAIQVPMPLKGFGDALKKVS